MKKSRHYENSDEIAILGMKYHFVTNKSEWY
jgi:hypothetical protein